MRFPKGNVPWNKGLKGFGKEFGFKKGNEHWKNPSSMKNQIKKGHRFSKTTEFKKGHKNSVKEQNAMYGKYPWNKGKSFLRKDANPNWQGGKSFEKYNEEWTVLFKESIRKRDQYVCQECGVHQDEHENRFRKLDIHHIDYNKKNCDPDNLISLCRECHVKTNFNRDYWFERFRRGSHGGIDSRVRP